LSAKAVAAKMAAGRDARHSKGKDMSSKSVLVAAAAVAASVAWQGALAQASAPVSRADVKAETRALEKAGKLTPAGEGGAPQVGPAASGPTTTRAQRKAETKAAEKAGKLTPAGPNQKADQAYQAASSSKTRAQRKAETVEARKKGELVPAGEGSPAPSK
jgi:hypothetical protein